MLDVPNLLHGHLLCLFLGILTAKHSLKLRGRLLGHDLIHIALQIQHLLFASQEIYVGLPFVDLSLLAQLHGGGLVNVDLQLHDRILVFLLGFAWGHFGKVGSYIDGVIL